MAASPTVQMSAEDLRLAGIGKTLGLVGAAVGVIGTIYTLRSNPVTRAKISSGVSSLPGPLKNPVFLSVVGSLAIAGVITWLVVKKKA